MNFDNATIGYLIYGLLAKKRVKEAYKMFKEAEEVDLSLCHGLMKGLLRMKRPAEATEVFREMLRREIEPNMHTYIMLLQGHMGKRGRKGKEELVNFDSIFVGGLVKVGKTLEASKYAERTMRSTVEVPRFDYNKFLHLFSNEEGVEMFQEVGRRLKEVGMVDLGDVLLVYGERMATRERRRRAIWRESKNEQQDLMYRSFWQQVTPLRRTRQQGSWLEFSGQQGKSHLLLDSNFRLPMMQDNNYNSRDSCFDWGRILGKPRTKPRIGAGNSGSRLGEQENTERVEFGRNLEKVDIAKLLERRQMGIDQQERYSSGNWKIGGKGKRVNPVVRLELGGGGVGWVTQLRKPSWGPVVMWGWRRWSKLVVVVVKECGGLRGWWWWKALAGSIVGEIREKEGKGQRGTGGLWLGRGLWRGKEGEVRVGVEWGLADGEGGFMVASSLRWGFD
ncbi:Putative pentatricopeptide repeat-containing protein [Dendrobium catenatum]|uniref:Pentatricopeptide repeat-containing protein n=1 Tax=Dendrobium catenatum TaxID=906689 RepID=A0A2I0WTM1_9ASPA|nr:Putative pentatricopeptide repeat-containing protein [Dendrobium catenatum]